MKPLLLLFAAVALAACQKPATESSAVLAPENGAHFKTGQGVAVTETMKKSIGLKIGEVEETKVAPSFTVTLHVMAEGSGWQQVALSSTSTTASGWLTAAQAALVQRGMEVDLGAAGARGVVKRLEKVPYRTIGDFEVTVECATPLESGARLEAIFRAPAGDAVTAIPRSALLKTAEGTFVYAVNGAFYMRTAVKVGALSDDHAEITDGLYSGDQIVLTPVMSLWLAELQVLRGGKACTCGH